MSSRPGEVSQIRRRGLSFIFFRGGRGGGGGGDGFALVVESFFVLGASES